MFTTNPQNPSDFDMTTGNFSVTGAIVDTQPPVLISTTMVKNQATLGEFIEILIEIEDDISGVASPNVLVEYPSGYRTYYGANIIDSDTVEFNLYVSDFLESGTYKVLALMFYDNAGNYSNFPGLEVEDSDPNVLRHDFSHLTFEISGTRPKPNIPSIVNAYVSDSVVNGGSSTSLTVEFEQVEVVFPDTMNAIYINEVGIQRQISLVYAGEGVYTGDILVGLYDAAAENELRIIYADFDGFQVQYHNQLTYPYGEHIADFSGASFIVANSIDDRLPPVLLSITSSPKLVGVNDNVLLNMVLSDNLSGIKYVEVVYNTPSGASISLPNLLTNETTVQLVHNVQKYHESGQYTVRYVRVDDQAGNTTFYVKEYLGYTNEIIYDFSDASFTVEGTLPVPQAPSTLSVSVDKPVLVGADNTTLRVTVDKIEQEYSYVYAYYINQFGESKGYHLNYIGNGVFEGTISSSLYDREASYQLTHIQVVVDEFGFNVFNEAYDSIQSPSMDLNGGDYSVEGTLPAPEAPSTVSVSVDKPVLVGADNTTLRVTVDKIDQEYSYAEVNYINQFEEHIGFYLPYLGNGVFEELIITDLFSREAVYQVISINIYIEGYGGFTFFNESYDPTSSPSMDLNGGNYSVTETEYENAPRFDYLSGSFDVERVTENQRIKYTLYLDNPNYEFEVIHAVFNSEHGREIYMQLYPNGEGVYEGVFDVQKYTTPGIYQLINLQSTIHDYWVYSEHMEGGTEFPYFDFSGDTFEVYGTVFDIDPPYVENSTVSKQIVEKGDWLTFDFYLADADSFVTGGYITLINEGNISNELEMQTFDLQKVSEGHYRIPLYIHSYVKNGKWSIYRIYVWDAAGNGMEYYNSEYIDYNPIELSHLDFIVQNNADDVYPPTLQSAEILTPTVGPNGLVEVQVEVQDDYSEIQKIHMSFIGKSTRQWLTFEGRMLSSGVNILNGYAWSGNPSDEYELIYVFMTDWAGNSTTICNSDNKFASMYCGDDVIHRSLPNMKFQLIEKAPVELANFVEEIMIEPSIVQTNQEVSITLKLSPEYWGVSSVNITFPDVNYPDTYPNFEMINMGNGVFYGTLKIDHQLKWKSEYRIGSISMQLENRVIYVVNESDAEIFYTDYDYISDFSNLKFSVIQDNLDQTSPDVGMISIGKSVYNQTENLVLNMQINESESRVENIIFRCRVDGEEIGYPFELGFYMPVVSKSGVAILERQLTKQFKPGFVEIDQIIVSNSQGLVTTLYNEKYYPDSEDSSNLDHLAFTLIGDSFDTQVPVFESIQLDKKILGPNETLNIEIFANDMGGSGVRSAIVFFKNTNDSTIFGHSLNARIKPDLDGRFIGSLNIDPFTLSGKYVISYIYLFDYAGNVDVIDPVNSYQSNDWNKFYYLDQSFTVVGTQLDETSPTLIDFNLNRQDALIGESIEATMEAFDDLSGIQFMAVGYYIGNVGFELYGYAPANPEDPFIIKTTISSYVQPGTYNVRYVYLQDKAGNVRTIYNSPVTDPELNIRNFSDKSITIYGQTEQITVESINISQQVLQPNSLVDVEMNINDDIIKPDQVTVYYVSNLGQQKEVIMNLSTEYDYSGQLSIGEFEPSDNWKIDRIVFIDRFNSEFILYNELIYLNQTLMFDASAADFIVENPEEGDLDAPQLNGVEVNKGTEDPNLANSFTPRLVTSYFKSVNSTAISTTAFYPNDIVEFKVDAVDDVSGVDRLLITYLSGTSTVVFDVALTVQADGTYIGRTRIKDFHPSGIWYVTKFVLVDKAGNMYTKQTTDPTSGLTMFDHLRLTVERTTHDFTAPALTGIQVTDKTLGKGEVLQILAEVSDDFSGVSKFEIIVSAKNIGVERKIVMQKTDSGQYVGQLNITDNIVADFWIIKSVELVDVAGNAKIIQNEKLSNPNEYETRNFDEQDFVVRGLASIQLVSSPIRLKYHIGDSFDPSGLRVKAIYTDGSEEEIDFSALVLHGYNNSIVNPKLNILVQYENRSTSFSINVYQRQPDQLVKLSDPTKTSYFVDEVIDLSGLSLRLVYDDGVTKDLTADECYVANPLVTSEAGQKQVIVQFANVTTTVNITVLKYSKSTPMQPEVDHVTNKTISLIEVSGQEYSMDGINWQNSGLFEGLNPNQEYYVYARWMESRTHLASSSSLAAIVRTDRSLAATPSAPTLLYRSDLMIEVETIEGQLYSIDGINWQQGGIFDRLQPNTTYYVTTKTAMTQTTFESNVSEPLIVTTDLLNPPTPVAPTLKDKTATSLEVFVVSGQEYSLDGVLWQDGGLFEGLLSYVEYSIYTRVKSTEFNYVSEMSEPLIIFTLKSMITLEINQQPTKLVYEQGDPINLSGLIVWGYFNDGSVENVTLSYVNIVNPEVTQNVPGYYTVVMLYDDFTVTFDIEVIAKVEKQTPVQITKTDTMMVIVTPKGKVKVIMFDNNGRTEIDGE
jgi:hypothetical protein